MLFIKKHYEKIILSVVLLGLAVAAAALPLQVSNVRRFLDETVTREVRKDPKPFKPLDEYLRTNEIVLGQFEGPVQFNFSTPHNIFNPVVWRKRPDGRLEKISNTETGAGALVVTKIDELKLMIEFDKAEPVGGGSNQFRYHFVVTRDTDSNPRKPQIATAGVPNTAFTLTRVEGSSSEPTAMYLQLKDEKREAIVAKEKPHVRVIGYAADLKYPRDNKPFLRKRVKEVLTLPNDTEKYKIVAISTNEVVLSAESTQKRTVIPFNAPPK